MGVQVLSPEEGAAHDGFFKRRLKTWALRQLESVLDAYTEAHLLTVAERARVRAALVELKDTKLRELWQDRGVFDTGGLLLRTAVATGLVILLGFAGPAAFIPAAVSTAVAAGGRLAVLYKMMSHAMEGRAALEIGRIEAERQAAAGAVAPAPRRPGWLKRFSQRIAHRVAEAYSRRYHLEGPELATLGSKVEATRIAKQRELWERRLPVELKAIAGTTAASAAIGVALGFTGPTAATLLLLSMVAASTAATGVSVVKLGSALEGTAHACVEDLAPSAKEGSKLHDLAVARSRGEARALAIAARIGRTFSDRYRLEAAERQELDQRLSRVAYAKEKELWEKRLAPAMTAPLGKGAMVTGVAHGLGCFEPSAIAGLLIGSLAEAGFSGLALYKELDYALEGVAYAYIKQLQAQVWETRKQHEA